jgi:uncharacterized protein (DUF1800 family)
MPYALVNSALQRSALRLALVALPVVLLQGCASGLSATAMSTANAYTQANRLTWGANPGTVARLQTTGLMAYLDSQLHPGTAAELPAEVQAQINDMRLSQHSFVALVQDMEERRKAVDVITGDAKKVVQQTYQTEMNRLAREAAARHLLRTLYSTRQVQKEMTWFWLNHFNVRQGKSNLRVDRSYTQQDVQELARVLTWCRHQPGHHTTGAAQGIAKRLRTPRAVRI